MSENINTQNHPAGRYRAKIAGHAFGVASTGTNLVAVKLEPVAGLEHSLLCPATADVYITDKSMEIAKKKLSACGFFGHPDTWKHGQIGDVDVIHEHTQNGLRIKFEIPLPSTMKLATDDETAKIKDKIGAMFGADPAPVKTPAPATKAVTDDDNVPF
jgi:hypothetical protein